MPSGGEEVRVLYSWKRRLVEIWDAICFFLNLGVVGEGEGVVGGGFLLVVVWIGCS